MQTQLPIISILEEQLKYLNEEKELIEHEIHKTKQEIHKYMETNNG